MTVNAANESSCSNNGDSSEADSLAAFTVMLPDLSALSQNMDIIESFRDDQLEWDLL